MATIELKTEIAGTVWKVLKAAGEPVAEDEPVLIMESMKMEVPVTSPEAGIVREILVAEGDPLKDGTPVARVEV